MSKIKKLIKTPGLFLRDYLIKKYPVEIHKIETLYSDRVDVGKINFPIDLVYTWVDGSDKKFIDQVQIYKKKSGKENEDEAVNKCRWKNHNELIYSLRSIQNHMPWVNKIYIVTNGQVPSWLNLKNNFIKIVKHSEFIPKKYLPTFNSHVIESCIHEIPDLSEHYIYFNDDIFILKDLSPEYFFTPGGDAISHMSNNELDNNNANLYDTDSIAAAKNSRDLIYKKYNYFFSRRIKHIFHPQIKSLAELIENENRVFFDLMRINKFREKNDLLCCSFLFPYIGYLRGLFIFVRKNTHWYIKIKNKSALPLYEEILMIAGTRKSRVAMCLNDHVEQDNLPNYQKYLFDFLERIYPNKSFFEK